MTEVAFFTDPSPFTHRARFYGFPAYYKSDGPDGCEIAGTNIIWDWCIFAIAPWIHWICECIRYADSPHTYEPAEWTIELRGKL